MPHNCCYGPRVRLHPTDRATHLSWTGAVALASGVILAVPPMVTFGAAVLTGVALSRALTLISVARARAAGFEMLWRSRNRTERATRLRPIELTAELRNRDGMPTRFRDLVLTHSPHLEIEAHPRAGEIPPGGRLPIHLTIRPLRVGYHGIHGITLQTIRAPGLHTVPLGFTNPFVIEVLPHRSHLHLPSGRGGRSRQRSPDGRPGPFPGDGPELRELREHRPGDPFKRIAWKASGRRGRLLVVEKESEQRDSIWVLVDASVDAFSGLPGSAPIDHAIDDAKELVEAHLARGDLVGLSICGGRELARVPLGRGPTHSGRLLSVLAFSAHTADADRSDWDDRDVQRRVIEHARSLDAAATAISSTDRTGVVRLATRLTALAPLQADAPWAPGESERVLRRYLLSFGIHPPPRTTGDRHSVELSLARQLRELLGKKPRPSVIYLLGHPPTFESPKELLEAIGLARRRRTEIRFVSEEEALEAPSDDSPQARLARDALEVRRELAAGSGRKALQRHGVRLLSRGAKRSFSPPSG